LFDLWNNRGLDSNDLPAFEFEMGLFPAVLDEAKHKGSEVAPKIIPPEAFAKRAVDKGLARFSGRRLRRGEPALRIKDGKSEVACDAGMLDKQEKDKKGIVTREALTNKEPG
jgi:site-specific DNA-methyltransferase (adenine-specific)/adenine-specific DNA-methyltransferase